MPHRVVLVGDCALCIVLIIVHIFAWSDDVLWLRVDSTAPSGGVTSAGLYRLLLDSSVSVLIMDVRSCDDFNASHIKTADCISVPADCIQLGSVLSCPCCELSQNVCSGVRTSWPISVARSR